MKIPGVSYYEHAEYLKGLLDRAVYYLKVRCDVPEDLIREVDKAISEEPTIVKTTEVIDVKDYRG